MDATTIQPSNPAPTPPLQPEIQSKSQGMKSVYLIIALIVVIILGVGGYLLLSNSKTSKTISQVKPNEIQTTPTPSTQPTPVISPVTSANADQTLNNTDTNIQQSVNQANSDLNGLNSIDQSQDNTNNL